MTRAQSIAHFRLWQQVCKANAWRWQDGRLHGKEPEALGMFARRVWEQAARRARAELRAATLDDLRHALYFLACGQVSSRRVNRGRDMTRVLGWLLLCLDDTSLEGAQRAGLAPAAAEEQARRVQAEGIRRLPLPAGYVERVATCRFGSRWPGRRWEDLPAADLRSLHRLLRVRVKQQHTKQPTTHAPEN